MAILAALTGRSASGRGTIVEIPMFECMTGFNLVEHLYGRHFSPPLGDTGYPRVLSPDRRPYRTSDGYICMMPYTDAHWRAFFVEAGAAEQATDARFASMAARTANIDALYEILADLIAQHETSHWLAACERIGVPASPIRSLEELVEDEHLNAVGFFSTLHDSALGALCMPGVPLLFDGARPPVTMPPRLGAHTLEVLAEIGMSSTEQVEGHS